MTDLYSVRVVDLRDDLLRLHLTSLYPDTKPPGGFAFAKQILRSFAKQLNQPDHPYLKTLNAESDAGPMRFIRAVHLVSQWRDEASAVELSSFAHDGAVYQGDTDWIMVIRVRLSEWLKDIIEGMQGRIGDVGTVGDVLEGALLDHNSTEGNDEYHAACRWNSSWFDGFLNSFLYEFLTAYHSGEPTMLSGSDPALLHVGLPHLVTRAERAHIDMLEYMFPFWPFAVMSGKNSYDHDQCAMLCIAHPGVSLFDAPVIVNSDMGEMPEYEVGTVFGNIGHFLDHMLCQVIEAQASDTILRKMVQSDRSRLARWAERNAVDMEWTAQSAYMHFFDHFCSVEAVAHAQGRPFEFSIVLDTLIDAFYVLSSFEQQQVLRALACYESIVLSGCLHDPERLLPELWGTAHNLFLFVTLDAPIVAHIKQFLVNTYREHPIDHIEVLFAALLRAEGEQSIEFIVDLVGSDDSFIHPGMLLVGLEHLKHIEALHRANQWPEIPAVDALVDQLERCCKARLKVRMNMQR